MKKGILKDKMVALLLCELAFGGLTLSGALLGINNSQKIEKERMQIVSEAGYDEFNAEYKKEQASDLLEQFKSGELSEYEYVSAVSSLKDYDVRSFMNEYASAEYLEEYKAVLKTDHKPFVYLGMFCSGFLGIAGVCYFAYKEKIKDGARLKKDKAKNEDFSIEDVVDCLKVTNSMAAPTQEPKEMQK